MSVLTDGYGASPTPLVLTQGYMSALPLRESFTVPLPDGATAQRAAGMSTEPYVGAQESAIGFGLNFGPWLAPGETLAALSVTVWAAPATGQAAYAATSSVVQAPRVAGTSAIVTLHAAAKQTSYHITCSVQTTLGRTLECRMPRIWCPDEP